MSSRKNKLNHFLAVWDMFGLESLHDVGHAKIEFDDWEKLKIVAILKEEKYPEKPVGIPINLFILRARANTQRQYEIYEFTTELKYKEVIKIFNDKPQLIVDQIRETGYKIYSDRSTIERVIA